MDDLALRRRQRKLKARKQAEERRARTLAEARCKSSNSAIIPPSSPVVERGPHPVVARRKEHENGKPPLAKRESSIIRKPANAEVVVQQKSQPSSPSKPSATVTVSRCTKASPTSSVSMSQQSLSQSSPAKKRPRQQALLDGDSSSDDDEDFLALCRKKKSWTTNGVRSSSSSSNSHASPAATKPSEEQKTSSQPVARKTADGETPPAIRTKPAVELSIESKKKQALLLGRKIDFDSDDEDNNNNNDDDENDPVAQDLRQAPTKKIAEPTTSSDATTEPEKISKAPRNPLTRMASAAAAVVRAPTVAEKTGDLMWDDSTESEKEQEEEATKKRKKRKRNNDRRPHFDTEYILQMEDAETGIDLTERKPEFSTPKFGPFALEPLLLGPEQVSKRHEVPASINRYLPEYQREGIQFLYNQAIVQHQGAILGDDMGLGKTVQVISFLAAILEKKGTGEDLAELKKRRFVARNRLSATNRKEEEALQRGEVWAEPPIQEATNLPKWVPILIIVPPSIIQNWTKDFGTWGHFAFTEFKGTERVHALHDIQYGGAEIMLCSKANLQGDKQVEELIKIQWKIVIVDEFHNFKNEKGKLAKSLRKLRDKHQSVVIGLTGTLMQNDHGELWNLVDLAQKNFFGSWTQFDTAYAKPIKLSRVKDATPDAIKLGWRKKAEISEMMRPIYVSRKKDIVLKDELPDKIERIVFCELSEVQKRIYRHILQQPDFLLLSKAPAPCDCGVNRKFFLEYSQLKTDAERIEYQRKHKNDVLPRAKCCYQTPTHEDAVIWHHQHPDGVKCEGSAPFCPYCIGLPALSILLKLCSHAALLQARHNPNQFREGCEAHKEAVKALDYAKVFLPTDILSKMPGGSYFRTDGIMDDHCALSGKMIVLQKLLRAIDRQQGRVLLFSASTQMLDLIQNFIKSEGFPYLRMDGSTPQSKRQEMVNEFMQNQKYFVFLLSTKAMGLGLNLTKANYVILFDVEWNPSWDAQAQDRAYRIGQEKDVKVFRLVSRGTLEEQKYLRQVYKTHLKKETLWEDGAEDADTAARLFIGVQGDSSRKGELFGLSNLLKFRDGTFMKYGSCDRRETKRFGGLGMHSNDAVCGTIKDMSEEDVANIAGDERNMFSDIALRTAGEDKEEEYDEDAMLGAESQINLEICKSTCAANDEGACQESKEGSVAATPIQTVSPSGDKRTEALEESAEIASVQSKLQREVTVATNTPQPAGEAPSNVQPLFRKTEALAAKTTSPMHDEEPANGPGVVELPREGKDSLAKKPMRKAGGASTVSFTAKKASTKRNKKKGSTTFGVSDLALPSGMKKKKKRRDKAS